MGPMGMPPPMREPKNSVPPPKGLRDVPRFVGALLGGFFSRLGYTVSMVWKTGPWILIVMILTCLFDGIMPIIGALLSKEILNEYLPASNSPNRKGIQSSFIGSFSSSPLQKRIENKLPRQWRERLRLRS